MVWILDKLFKFYWAVMVFYLLDIEKTNEDQVKTYVIVIGPCYIFILYALLNCFERTYAGEEIVKCFTILIAIGFGIFDIYWMKQLLWTHVENWINNKLLLLHKVALFTNINVD